MYQIWCQSVEQFDSFPRHLNLWPPKTPQNALWGIVGRLVFIICPFPDESADVNQSWCQSVQPFDSFSRLLNFWSPKTPQNAPWDIKERIVYSLCPFQDESADVYQIWCQSVQLFDSFPRLLNLWPPKTPWDIEGRIVFSLCPFPDESSDVYQIWCRSVQPFDSFPRLLNLWPPSPLQMPPGVLRGDLHLAYVHSQMNPQTWTKVGANRSSRLTASSDFWMFDP